MHLNRLLVFIWFTCIVPLANAELVVSYPKNANGISELNPYHNYFRALLELSLEKTRGTYGDFTIIAAPANLTPKRLVLAATQNLYPNLVFEMPYDEKFDASSGITFILFPVDLGVMGYRVCFVNPAIKNALEHANTLTDLNKYSIGQGTNWVDSDILRHNGFIVKEFEIVQNIFKTLAAGRIDLFCRGSNQFLDEYNIQKNETDLVYDETFVLKYPLPRFFYFSAKNTLLKKRIEEGILIAYKDHSLLTLWEKHFKANVTFTHLRQRKVFLLENPLIRNLPKSWEQYIYIPKNENGI